ncbi:MULTISPECIES: TonB-dependent receptor plug domain-containing protein [unclassified Sphingobium]|uniref:TonB-dependent receptor plug domain-containing protein n=1 Tax=unclassified Sphingobium TaxID=2611147 RepID=UPI002225B36B|nr:MULTISPECIES: TonB-dependent receptor [unclassified Sphingobium]MCW2412175.1 iron complex outermembrane receptor protein [Sphingobium sp. B8D3D]MCW2415528.1 iron complex outermembrane receptor protein [Sphingobium sp. B8D3A]
MAKNGFRRASALGFVSFAALVTSQGVSAQTGTAQTNQSEDDAANTADIVVTGTQLRGVAPVGSSVIAVGQQEIRDTGLATTSDILKTIPQVSALGPGEATLGTNVNSATLNSTRANGVNLRGLGTQATLTLLDGRRAPPGGVAGQLFDASVIPAIALERIDIVADGASATYGSDAVAGVANLILRRNFDGLEASARYGFADGYDEWQGNAILGKKWDTGSVMIAGDYYYHSRLRQEDRAELFQCDQRAFGGLNNCAFTSSPGNVIDPATFTRYGLPGGSGENLTPANLSTTPNFQQSYVNNDLLPQLKRWSVIGRLDQELTPALKMWASGFYSKRTLNQRAGSLTLGAATPVPSSNPYFIEFAPGQTSQIVEYAFNEYGPIQGNIYESSYQLATGFDYSLDGNWQLSIYGSHGATEGGAKTDGFLNTALLSAALADSNPATALNVYGTGQNSRDQIDRLVAFFDVTGLYTVDLVNVKTDGALFNIGGGAVRMAVGGEFHHDYYRNTAAENINGPSLSQINLFGDTASSRDVWSAFAEVNVPLVGAANAMPGIDRLELNIAGRYDHYSDVGGTTNPKFGIRYDPVPGVSAHASYGTSFRAPTLSDTNPASTATVFSIPNFGPFGNVIEYVGGNADLKPEKATTWSVGVKFTPPSSGFTASLDYFNIDYKDVIETAPVFSVQVFTDPAYAPFVTFNPTVAQVNAIYDLPWAPPAIIAASDVDAIVDARRNNVGRIKMDGLDFLANYAFDLGGGSANIGVSGTYLLSYGRATGPTSPTVDRLNLANFPLRFRGRANLGWRGDNFGATMFVNYTNAYTNTVGTIAPSQPVDSYTTVDLTLTYDVPKADGVLSGLSFSLSALNLFDAAPPFAAIANNQVYDSTVANPLGRFVSLTVRKAF